MRKDEDERKIESVQYKEQFKCVDPRIAWPNTNTNAVKHDRNNDNNVFVIQTLFSFYCNMLLMNAHTLKYTSPFTWHQTSNCFFAFYTM